MDTHGITFFTYYIIVDLDIFRTKVGKGGIIDENIFSLGFNSTRVLETRSNDI